MERAKASDRLRMNYNLDDSPEAKAKRLLNALEPGTELPIHRHRETAETYIVLRGSLRVIFYNDKKEIIDTFLIDPKMNNYGIHIPKGQWHTIEILETGTVIFEVMQGLVQLKYQITGMNSQINTSTNQQYVKSTNQRINNFSVPLPITPCLT